MSQVTQLLNALDAGDSQAADQLLPLVYEELRKLAAAKMAQEQPGQTLQPTALVHEAWLRLVGTEEVRFSGRRSKPHPACMASRTCKRLMRESNSIERVRLRRREMPHITR